MKKVSKNTILNVNDAGRDRMKKMFQKIILVYAGLKKF